jgi:hypothetical protein
MIYIININKNIWMWRLIFAKQNNNKRRMETTKQLNVAAASPERVNKASVKNIRFSK